MSKPNEYLCTERAISMMEDANLSLEGLRLLHGCYFHVDKTVGLHLAEMGAPIRKPVVARSRAIMAATGTPSANDYDMIHDGIENHQGKGLFATLEASENSRKLKFMFSNKLVENAVRGKSDKFAMIDVDLISTLRTSKQILFYARVAQVEQQDHPLFQLPWRPSQGRWTEAKKAWLNAACRVGDIFGHDYVFEPMIDPQTDEVSWVKVKIVKKVSAWMPDRLFPRDASVGVSVVVNGEATTLLRAELRKRRKWTRADRP